MLVSSGTSDAFLRGLIFSRWEFITLQEPPYTVAENESNAYFERLAAEAGTVWERDDYETDQILNEEAKRVPASTSPIRSPARRSSGCSRSGTS